MDSYDAAIKYAADLGAEHGRNAAEWHMQDHGNRQTTAYMLLRGIEDGDPAVLDTFPAPDLSGEWADSLTGPQLYADAMDAARETDRREANAADGAEEWFSDICDAYEMAFSTAVEDEIGRVARYQVAP